MTIIIGSGGEYFNSKKHPNMLFSIGKFVEKVELLEPGTWECESRVVFSTSSSQLFDGFLSYSWCLVVRERIAGEIPENLLQKMRAAYGVLSNIRKAQMFL